MKKPRILKLEYHGCFFVIDLEEVQGIMLKDNQLSISFVNNEIYVIDQSTDDTQGSEITRLCLNTYVSWKNYDEERGKEVYAVMHE